MEQVMELGGLDAILQAVQAKHQAFTVCVYNLHDVLLGFFEAPANTTLSMLYSLVGRAMKMQGFTILRKDKELLTCIDRLDRLDVCVDAFGTLASMYQQGK